MPPAVIVRGMGLRCALGMDVAACHASLVAGRAAPQALAMPTFTETLSLPFYAVPGDNDLFDPARAVALLEGVGREAVANAGLTGAEVARLPIFIGTSAFSLENAASAPGTQRRHQETGEAVPLIGYQEMADTLLRALGSRGDTYAFLTACTSAANAVISAARMIELGWYDQALVVGLEMANLATMSGFSSLQLVATELKPFDRERQGIVLGEGVGAVVLARAEAVDAGLHIRAGASNVDSYRVTTTNPDGGSIAALQRTVLQRSGVATSAIRGIKAHGTGSPMNDASEAAGIRRVFDAPPPVCALKPYLGHTLGACGVNELILMVKALEAGFIPATPGFATPDPELGVVPTTAHTAAGPGHYLLNFFGFGGHNSVMLVEHRA